MNRRWAIRIEGTKDVLQYQVVLQQATGKDDLLLIFSWFARIHFRQVRLQLLHRPAPLTLDGLVVVLLIGSLDYHLHGGRDPMVSNAPIARWWQQILHDYKYKSSKL